MKILDLTAGKRVMWFDKTNPLATFVDIRPEVEPTYCADSTALPSAVGSGYTLVVFDPPHVNVGAGSTLTPYYGHSTTEEILRLVRGAAKEAHRVTEPNALMIFKWADHDIKLEKVLSLMSKYWEPLFGQRTSARSTTRKAVIQGTYWIVLRRK